MQTWLRDDYGAQTFRTTTSKGHPWQLVARQITKHRTTGKILEDLAVNPSEQQLYDATIPGGPRDIRTILHYLVRPAAPRRDAMFYVSFVPLSRLWVEEFDATQWMIVLFWSALSTSAGDTMTPPGKDGGPPPQVASA